jgi:hypothetical protein
MHRRLRALAVVVLAVSVLAVVSSVVARSDGTPAPRREAAVMAARTGGAVIPLTTSRSTRERLPTLVAVLAALVLASTVTRRTERPSSAPRHTEVASTQAPSRAPPAPQNLAF